MNFNEALFTDWSFNFTYVNGTFEKLGLDATQFIFAVAAITLLYFVAKRIEVLEKMRMGEYVSQGVSGIFVYALLAAIVVLVWVYLASLTGYSNSFIYFQF